MEANVLKVNRDARLVMERAKIVLRILDNEEIVVNNKKSESAKKHIFFEVFPKI